METRPPVRVGRRVLSRPTQGGVHDGARFFGLFLGLAPSLKVEPPQTPHFQQEARLVRASAVAVESLEERRLFASFSVASNVLTVTGTSSAETITVFRNNSGTAVKVAVSGSADQYSSYYTTLTQVDVFGNGGNDAVDVETTTNHPVGDDRSNPDSGNKVNISTRLFGGDGNDTLLGGEQTDTVDGGNGDDSIRGGEDNDTLYGGYGTDSVKGETGNDLLYGGDTGYGATGDTSGDFLEGGPGSDTAYGQYGNDTLQGGDGADYLLGGNGGDLLDGDVSDGVDTIDGGTGGIGDSDSAYNGSDNILNGIEYLI